MKKSVLLSALLLSIIMFTNALAQHKWPFVYNVENTGANTPVPYMPTLNQLPVIQSLPDPFEWADGRGRMQNYSDWRLRRAEIGDQIQHYEIGEKPPRPDSITATFSASDSMLTIKVTVNDRTLTLSSKVNLPSGSGPFPIVIGMNTPVNFILPSGILGSHSIATIEFNANQVTPYSFSGTPPSTSDPYYQLYPNLNPTNTGQYSAWAWGVSRIIDGLELVHNVLPIDLSHIAVAGCSYAGKMALFSGAFDERVALTIALESGGGGATSWRYSHTEPAGSVEDIDNTDYNWFENSMSQFSGDNVYRLPEDHHELMAMVAPRALYVTANPSYTWLSNPSCYVASKAAKNIYNALGISDRFGFSIIGGHTHCQVPDSQVPEINAFVDKFLFGKDTVNTDTIADSPYNINLSSWITWANPTLGNDTTYFTALAYPSNKQVGLDTSITFKWDKVNKAETYYFELSTDPSFTSIDKSDSITIAADTSETFSGLSESTKYYWRVKVKSTSGVGPWSNAFSFVTTLTLPTAPQLVSANSNSIGYVTLKWNRVAGANQYSIQIAFDSAFTTIFKSSSTSDTSTSLSWFSEGKEYYWRVKASNLAGNSLWSNIENFTILYAPTNLDIQDSTSNQVKLTWTNNSSIADGNVIERMESPQTSFSVIDTVKGTGNTYVDKNVKPGTVNYRIKAYKDSLESEYSNEVSITVTGIKGEKRQIPTKYSVNQNYPNPFNPTTEIGFALPKSGLTKVVIYDVLGREIQTLLDKELKAGYYEVTFNADNLPSGVYFYRIHSGDFIQTKKMILMK